MTTTNVHPMIGRLGRLVALDVARADRDTCKAALADYGTLVRFLQGLESRVALRLSEVSPSPELDTSNAANVSGREADQSQKRAKGRQDSGPAGEALGAGMDEGAISGAHLDAYLRVRNTLARPLRDEFSGRYEVIADWAKVFPVDIFTRRLKLLADELREQLGIRLLDEQKRQNSLRTWLDKVTGMFRISGAFDPESALAFKGRLEGMVQSLFAEATPNTCPEDPEAKQDHLRALALLALTQHGPTCSGGGAKTEVVIVADTTQRDVHGQPSVDWGLPVDLPFDVLTNYLMDADRLTVVDLHRNGRIVDHSERLDLGRSTRLANRAQRRVLRARHSTCVVPGCDVPFDRCDIHHVTWWRHGGTTDLVNLAPLCGRHHDRVHSGGWALHVDADGMVTVQLPNGEAVGEHGSSQPAHAPPASQSSAGPAAYASSVPAQEVSRGDIT